MHSTCADMIKFFLFVREDKKREEAVIIKDQAVANANKLSVVESDCDRYNVSDRIASKLVH